MLLALFFLILPIVSADISEEKTITLISHSSYIFHWDYKHYRIGYSFRVIDGYIGTELMDGAEYISRQFGDTHTHISEYSINNASDATFPIGGIISVENTPTYLIFVPVNSMHNITVEYKLDVESMDTDQDIPFLAILILCILACVVIAVGCKYKSLDI